jgi:hypothetical protein
VIVVEDAPDSGAVIQGHVVSRDTNHYEVTGHQLLRA